LNFLFFLVYLAYIQEQKKHERNARVQFVSKKVSKMIEKASKNVSQRLLSYISIQSRGRGEKQNKRK
jgi:hypothetical protein